MLRIYLPTCEDNEAAKIFGPAVELIAEKDVNTDTSIQYHQFVRTHQGVIDIQEYESTEYEVIDHSIKPHQYNFLKIREEQMRALMDEVLEKDYQQIKRQFINDFIDTPSEPIYVNDKPVSLDAFLRGCLGHAISFKIEDQYSLYSFFNMCYQHGWKFWDQDNNLWAKSILESSRKGDIKIEKLESQFSSRLMDQLWSA